MIQSMPTPPKKKPRPQPSPAARQALQALRRGIHEAAKQHRQAGVPMAIWKNGRVVLIHP